MHVRVVDIDGDGELDLLIGNRNSAALEVLRGEGHGVSSLPFTGFFAAEWGFDER